jgi:hypothetical protein
MSRLRLERWRGYLSQRILEKPKAENVRQLSDQIHSGGGVTTTPSSCEYEVSLNSMEHDDFFRRTQKSAQYYYCSFRKRTPMRRSPLRPNGVQYLCVSVENIKCND